MMTTLTMKPLLEWTAADLMSRHLLMVPHEMSIQGAARMLSRAQVTGAPVVDSEGRCVGVVSATDFLHWAERDHPTCRDGACNHASDWEMDVAHSEAQPTVRDVMTLEPVMAHEEARIHELARMMLDAHIHRVIVADERSRPIGIVTTTDILAALSRAGASEGGIDEGEGKP